MKTFKQLLTEKRKNNIIIVDIQPMYDKWMHINRHKLCEFIKEQGKILYFYNGHDTVGDDSKYDIIEWYNEISDYDEELNQKLDSSDVFWYDKGYAFFRGWMDNGADAGFIKKAIRFMMERKVNDSRDIKPEEWEEKFPRDWQDSFKHDNIYLPDIPINKLKTYSGSYLIGGGKNECLAEVQILMSIFNIHYTLIKDYVY